MNQLARIHSRGVARFNPTETLERTSVLESAIDHAKRMRDWQALDEAIDWLFVQIEEGGHQVHLRPDGSTHIVEWPELKKSS